MLTIPFIIENIFLPGLVFGVISGGIIFLFGLLIQFVLKLFNS